MIGAVELGLIYGVMAIGVYLTFRVLNFPDLTVDGSFTTGAAVAAVCLSQDMNPVLALLLAFAAGAIAGALTDRASTISKIWRIPRNPISPLHVCPFCYLRSARSAPLARGISRVWP